MLVCKAINAMFTCWLFPGPLQYSTNTDNTFFFNSWAKILIDIILFVEIDVHMLKHKISFIGTM